MYIVAEDMEAFDCIATKLDIREYSNEDVPGEYKVKYS